MSRTWTIIAVAALALATAALAQAPGGPAPATHPGTKLAFPPSLGGAALGQSRLDPPASGSHNPMYSYRYAAASKMEISVFIFDKGRHVPSGSDSPTLISQFAGELTAAEERIRANGYGAFERPAVPSTCTFGSVTFRCVVFSAASQGNRVYGKLMMTGFRDSFLTIRIDWSNSHGQTSADADRALAAFVPALLH